MGLMRRLGPASALVDLRGNAMPPEWRAARTGRAARFEYVRKGESPQCSLALEVVDDFQMLGQIANFPQIAADQFRITGCGADTGRDVARQNRFDHQ